MLLAGAWESPPCLSFPVPVGTLFQAVLCPGQQGKRGLCLRAGQGREEGREEKRLSGPAALRAPVAPAGGAATDVPQGWGRGLMGCATTSATPLSAPEESRSPPPLLGAARRTLGGLSEKLRGRCHRANYGLEAPARVALGSALVASPGLSPAGCRALAPPAEAQEAVPAATGASCRDFLCRRGLAAARPPANLSGRDKRHGKGSWDGGECGYHAVLCGPTHSACIHCCGLGSGNHRRVWDGSDLKDSFQPPAIGRNTSH